MLFGIHSLLFNETFTERDLPLLDKCKKLGFDAVELIPFDPDNHQNVRPLLRRRHLLNQHAVGQGKAAHASTQNAEEMSSAITFAVHMFFFRPNV